MLRTIGICEKNLAPIPANVVTIPAATSTEVIKDTTNLPEEVAYTSIQNVGTGNIYYAFGQSCDNVASYNGILAPLAAVPVPSTCQVTVYATNGGLVATTQFKRIGL